MPSLSIKFDFRHYLPSQDLNSGTIQLDSLDCGGDSFIVALLAENLVPGHSYRTTYELLSPTTTDNVFNPSVSSLYASFATQNLVTSAKLPSVPNSSSNSYILKASIRDLTEGSNAQASTQINLICGFNKPAFQLEMLDPDLQPVPPDNVIDVGDCSNAFPLVCMIKDAGVGKEYSYEFHDNPAGGIVFEKRSGSVFAGDVNQNFNSRVALTGYPYVFVHAEATEISTGITKTSQPVLLKCYQTNPCDVVLPTGVDCAVGNVPVFKKCSQRGLTIDSISAIYGGQGFAIGDTLTTTGGGGYGAQIQVLSGGITQDSFSSFVGGSGLNINDLIEVTGGGGAGGLIKITSGGLTNNSITSLTGCVGFKVGDLLTTAGGGGKDALISVSSTGINGSISSYSVVNPGYGYTGTPSGVISLVGNSYCTSAVFNADNFTVPCKGGITNDSINTYGGNGYNIGEILNLVGGGGTGAQIKVLTGSITSSSLTLSGGSGYQIGDLLSTTGGDGLDSVIRVAATGSSGSISSFEVLNGGYGFVSAPTGIYNLASSGSNAVFTGNANNFAITSKGSITKSSINGLINSGIGFSVGDKLIVAGGGGGGGLIQVVSVSNGVILDYAIINNGSGYVSSPQLLNENQSAIPNQPSWSISKFTKYSIVVINSGCDYINAVSVITSSNGDGTGAVSSFDANKYTSYAYIVVNSGSGYTSSPTGFVVKSGDGSGVTATFNSNNFTIPCSGGITYNSISGLIGKSSFMTGEELIVDGGGGTGGRLKITETNNGSIASFVVINAGCDYTSSPTLKRLNGTPISGVSFNANNFTQLAISLTDPGFGFIDSPSGLSVITGTGSVDSVFVQFNSDNFLEVIGPEPSPSPTPTPTVTPSLSAPAPCNALQSAGGANQVYTTTVAVSANSGQNYIVVANTNGLSLYSIVQAQGIGPGTYITKVENYFANFNDRIIYKKITINTPTIDVVPLDSSVTIYETDTRLIKVPYWPGNMVFTYDAYSVPDRFLVFAVPSDPRQNDTLLFDSWYRGNTECGYVPSVSGVGFGTANIMKPDGCVLIKVVVEAPCEGTAWEYSLGCPTRVFTTISPTPTRTPTLTPTPTSSQLPGI